MEAAAPVLVLLEDQLLRGVGNDEVPLSTQGFVHNLIQRYSLVLWGVLRETTVADVNQV